MVLFDVNVLVYAHRADAPNHTAYRQWLEGIVNGPTAYGVSELVISGFMRVVTHPRVFDPPSTFSEALTFAKQVRDQPHAVLQHPGPRHWDIFISLCKNTNLKGNLVPDAYLAALAIESGCEWVTTDRDFSRFPGLKWSHPLSKD
jgi:toxin-antitoxin system PIN domain toxin